MKPSTGTDLKSAASAVSRFQWRLESDWPVIEKEGPLANHLRDDSVRDFLTDDDWQNLSEFIENWPTDFKNYRSITLQMRYAASNPWIVAYVRPVGEDRWEALISSLENHLREGETLFRSKERLELVLEGTRLGMWDWNPQTNAVHFDQRWAEMLGYDITEIDMKLSSWQDRVHPDDLAGCFADIQNHMEGRTDFYENVHRMKHRDGRWIYILDRGRIVEWDEEGQPIRFTGTHTDISREKNAEMAAAEALKAKSLFLASMSHELRTPIHGMLGMAELLQHGVSAAEQEQYLHYIESAGKSLLRLISDILDVSRFEADSVQLKPVRFSLRKHFEETLEMHRKPFNEKGLTLKLEMAKGGPEFIKADSIRLRQIVSNLINNALKFTDRGGALVRVHAKLRAPKQWDLTVSVEDTGRGIEQQNLEQVFDLFVQGNQGKHLVQEGVGLGLHICKTLVEKMGGDIQASSQMEKGSEFSFCIPVAEAIAAEDFTRKRTENFSESGLRILVVEDSELNRVLIRRFLAYLGLECQTVETGLEALQNVENHNPDLIFMDLGIPGMGGLETTRRIRALPIAQPHIIALTADAFLETQQECMAAGMNQFLSKPFDLHQLSECIAMARDSIFSA